MTWDERFETTLRSHLPNMDAATALHPDLSLAACGLDSLGTIGLITSLEGAYGIRLPDEAFAPAHFTTPGRIWSLLRSLLGSGSGDHQLPVPSPADGNDTRLLHHWFLDGLARNPDGLALRVDDRAWTYSQLHQQACRWAGTLLKRCGGRPKRVGILASRTEEAYAGLLAALYAGATVVPLDPGLPVERNRTVAAAAALDAMIVDRAGAAQLDAVAAAAPLRAALTGSEPPPSLTEFAVVTPDSTTTAEPCTSAEPVAYIMFTSGSTGDPKGVPVRHGNIGAFLQAVLPRYDIGPQDVVGHVSELTFDLSVLEVWAAWSSGACLTVLNRIQALGPERFARRHGITFWVSTPSLVAALRTRGALEPGSLPDLRHTVFCGEPLPERTALYWSRIAPRSAIDNLYGPTELTVACTGYRWTADGTPDGPPGNVPIGQPLPGVRHLLLGDDGEVSDTVGELCVTGAQRFDGYLDPAADTGCFLDRDNERWYRTGDRVCRDGEVLLFLDRVDNQVKIHGYRVELGEVEQAIRRVAPGLETAVLAVPDGGTLVLAAFVMGDGGADVTSLVQRLADRLPHYMLPRYVWPLPDPPLNASGKADRSALRAEAARRTAAQAGGS
ncbi:AMP-binding protein [Streptomyces anulatus]